MKELTLKYNPAEVEAGRYCKMALMPMSSLQAIKSFSFRCLFNHHQVIPPPNVIIGKLHLGHAWDTTPAGYHHPSKTHARL